MIKSGAPPDKVGDRHCQLPIEFHGFTSRINSKGYHSLVPGLISTFLETVWVPLKNSGLKENRIGYLHIVWLVLHTSPDS